MLKVHLRDQVWKQTRDTESQAMSAKKQKFNRKKNPCYKMETILANNQRHR